MAEKTEFKSILDTSEEEFNFGIRASAYLTEYFQFNIDRNFATRDFLIDAGIMSGDGPVELTYTFSEENERGVLRYKNLNQASKKVQIGHIALGGDTKLKELGITAGVVELVVRNSNGAYVVGVASLSGTLLDKEKVKASGGKINAGGGIYLDFKINIYTRMLQIVNSVGVAKKVEERRFNSNQKIPCDSSGINFKGQFGHNDRAIEDIGSGKRKCTP